MELVEFIIINKEFQFFLRTYIHKSFILASKLHAPQIDETCPNYPRAVLENSHVFIF